MTFSLPNRWDAPLFATEHLKIQLFWRNQSSQVFLVFCKLPSVTAAIAWLRVFNLLFHWFLHDSTLFGTDIHMAAKCVASAPSAKMMLPLRVKIPWLFRQKCYILRNCQKNYHVFFSGKLRWLLHRLRGCTFPKQFFSTINNNLTSLQLHSFISFSFTFSNSVWEPSTDRLLRLSWKPLAKLTAFI